MHAELTKHTIFAENGEERLEQSKAAAAAPISPPRSQTCNKSLYYSIRVLHTGVNVNFLPNNNKNEKEKEIATSIICEHTLRIIFFTHAVLSNLLHHHAHPTTPCYHCTLIRATLCRIQGSPLSSRFMTLIPKKKMETKTK